MPARRSTRLRRASQPARRRASQPARRRGSQAPRRRGSQRYTANVPSLCLDKRAQRAWAAAGMGCNVVPMTDFPYKDDEVVHIKGFASGMWDRTAVVPNSGPEPNMTAGELGATNNPMLGPNTQSWAGHKAQSLISGLMEGKARKVLVWDGDALADDSYTKFIELKCKTVFKDYILAPFVKKEDLADRIKSWKKSPVFDRITFYVTPNFPNWMALGVAALSTTGSRNVVCLGGGGTVRDELKIMRILDTDTDWGAGVHFHALPFKRYLAEKDDKKRIVKLGKIEEGFLTDKSKNLDGPLLYAYEAP